jgi:hypothetical protein
VAAVGLGLDRVVYETDPAQDAPTDSRTDPTASKDVPDVALTQGQALPGPTMRR